MYAVVGQAKIEPGYEDEMQQAVAARGVTLLQRMAGSSGGWWYRTTHEGDLVQHSFWLFDTESHAQAAEEAYHEFRAGPLARTSLISVGVHEVFAHA
jgi:hypothetical protein